MLDKWTQLIIRRRNLVFALWLLALILGAISSTQLNSHLTIALTIPGSSSAQSDEMLARQFNENIEGTFTVIYPFKNASATELKGFEDRIAIAAAAIPTGVVTQEKAIGGTLYANINSSLALSKAARYTDNLRTALKSAGLPGALVTGPPAIQNDVTPILANDLHRGELLGLFVALLILIVALGFSTQILIPFLFAAGSISATVGLIFLVAQKFLVVLYIPNIVELIGLGLAIDYSLLILFRFRREYADSPDDLNGSIVKTMASAGRTVALSSMTVAITLASLVLVPIPFVRSLGVASALVPLVSLAAAFTLQPALLSLLKFHKADSKMRTALFSRLPELIVRRPLIVAISALIALVGLALPIYSLHITPSSFTAVPAQIESQRALSLATAVVGTGVITPNQLLIDLGAQGLASSAAIIQARSALSAELLKNPEVGVVAAGEKPPYVDSTRRYLRIFVIGHHSFGAPESQALVQELRALNLAHYGFPNLARLYIGGAAAQGVDLIHVLSRTIPWIGLLALLITFLLLLRAFKSLVLPIKAIALDLISLAVTFGIVVLAFGHQNFAKALGIYHLNAIEAWAAVFLGVLLFGVSMDYEIFIISRIKEAKDRGLSNADAITEGVTQTGIVVTSAALIFIGAVSGLALGHFAGLQEIGIGLVFGVLIDATIVRGLLLPSVMVLLGRWNWWLPTFIARIIKTSPTPLDEVRG